MPSLDERREVAARLRAIDDTEWTHPREELRALDEALGTAQGMPYALQTTWERFADLIEPEPERTCEGCIKIGIHDWCEDCARSKPDLYHTTEDTDAD
jgi:hypothetical protein